MAELSQIQWCDATWNIARGCSKVDGDCKYCYMYRQSLNGTRYAPDQVIKTKTVFNLPLKYKETKSECWDGRPLIFTSSLTDFFHEDIDGFRSEAWDIIRKCPHLIFQILTKRPERIADHLPEDWGDGWDNVWLGTSIGSSKGLQRLFDIQKVKAKVIFLSLEPMYERINFEFDFGAGIHSLLKPIDWVIVGGESGNEVGKYKYRPCQLEWIENIVTHCLQSNTPVFVKQVGTYLSKKLGMKDRHGGDFSEFPQSIKVRQFPNKK